MDVEELLRLRSSFFFFFFRKTNVSWGWVNRALRIALADSRSLFPALFLDD